MDPTIWVAIITAATTLIITFGPRAFRSLRNNLRDKAKKLDHVHEQLDEVHEQVKNTHQTNLREDIDLLIKAVNGLRDDMRVMRNDQVIERRERFALSERLDESLRKLLKEE